MGNIYDEVFLKRQHTLNTYLLLSSAI